MPAAIIQAPLAPPDEDAIIIIRKAVGERNYQQNQQRKIEFAARFAPRCKKRTIDRHNAAD